MASQQKLAKLAGCLFIVAMMTGLFAEVYVHFPSSLIIAGDAAKTAYSIASNSTLYRVGIANNIATFVIDVVLIWCLYLVTKPVNTHLALLGLLFRLIETTAACTAISQSLAAMQIVSDLSVLGRISPEATQALSELHYAYASNFTIAAIFLGFGSAIFNYLLYTSRYVPRPLAGLGIFASLLLAFGQLAVIVAPNLEHAIVPAGYAPIVVDEIALGLWLLVRGVRLRD